jgi:diguanylate cyclase (GGDEF)-like protein
VDIAKELLKYSSELSVLYVEDDKDLRKNTSIFLNDIFKDIDEVSNGSEGWKKFKEKSFDIVITDLTMPGDIDGLSLIKLIRKEKPSQAIIITSAHGESKIFLESILLGVDGFILKPMNFTFFLSTLKKISYNVVARKDKEEQERELKRNLKLSREKIYELDKLVKESGEIDNLTSLKNKKSFDKTLYEIQSENIETSAMMVDIDRFTNVNRIYGMEYGDKLLQLLGERLNSLLNRKYPMATLYRIESDKFVFLIRNSSLTIEQSLIRDIDLISKNSFLIFEKVIVNIKLLISIIRNVEKEERVLSKLIRTMVEKKANRGEKNCYIYYDQNSPFLKKQEENILWMNRIQEVIKNRDVYPVFQRIIDNKTKKVVKYEALMRIKYDGETISPAKFIEPATILGLLPELTKIMIEKTFIRLQNSDVKVSINISEEDINEGYLLTFVSQQLKKYKINSNRITFEILENMTTLNYRVLEHLQIFKDIGVGIAIDDFGSESSNFSRLSSVQANIIKIDGQFIKDLDQNRLNMKIVKAIVFLAKEFECKIVAEFVHNEEIYEIVKSLGIDYSQGYFFGAPQVDLN